MAHDSQCDPLDHTDINVEYQHSVGRKIHLDLADLERFYSSSSPPIPSASSVGLSSASLLDRAAAILSPSSSTHCSNSLASLGGEIGGASALSASTPSPIAPVRVLNEDSMRRVIEKEDFRQMQVIGQFNLGFIITKLNDDLFIIDQHATDEKYRFETLQRTTVLNSQPLLNPLPLDLSPDMEITMIENMEIFKKNGFEIDIRKDDEDEHQLDHMGEEESTPPLSSSSRHRIRVKALPFSKNITFGADDIYQLCALLTESPGVMVRLPKVTAMFASRACRSSVMIGTSLTHSKMSTIVDHMADLNAPWSCPHGRPTMRHLVELKGFRRLHSNHESTIAHYSSDGDDGEQDHLASTRNTHRLASSHSAPATCCHHH